MDPDSLPPELAAALQALPREASPSPGEEDRTVRALRRRGLLPQPRWRRYAVALGRVTAAVAIFAAGALYGGERASRHALETMLDRRDRDAQATALLVQRAGSAYVRALVDLAVTARAAPTDPALAGGREAALTSLRAAAAQLQRIGPAGAVDAELRGRTPAPAAPPRDARQLYWF